MDRRRSSMKVKQLIKIAEAVDDKLPSDMYDLDDVEHHSTTHDEPIRIADMDVVHLVRAFRHQERMLNRQVGANLISKLARERDMWKEKAMNMVEKETHEKEWEHWKARAEMWRKEYEKATSKKGCNYVFSEIPNDTDGQELVDSMKKYLNKDSYKMRVRGQHVKEELRGTGVTYWGQNLDESTHMRIYIEAKKGD
jgi:hypothetical protein